MTDSVSAILVLVRSLERAIQEGRSASVFAAGGPPGGIPIDGFAWDNFGVCLTAKQQGKSVVLFHPWHRVHTIRVEEG